MKGRSTMKNSKKETIVNSQLAGPASKGTAPARKTEQEPAPTSRTSRKKDNPAPRPRWKLEVRDLSAAELAALAALDAQNGWQAEEGEVPKNGFTDSAYPDRFGNQEPTYRRSRPKGGEDICLDTLADVHGVDPDEIIARQMYRYRGGVTDVLS
jgi:hypothetical protein